MQATMSAVDYVVANYPTTEVWAHGTSAGSTGAYNLAMSFRGRGHSPDRRSARLDLPHAPRSPAHCRLRR